MECLEIKLKMSEYLNHSLDETETSAIEEHLCICNSCREQLSQFMDGPANSTSTLSTKKSETLNKSVPKKTTASIRNALNLISIKDILSKFRLKIFPGKQAKISKLNKTTKPPEATKSPQDKFSKLELLKNNFADYIIVAIGLTILIFFIFLLLKK